MPLVTTTEMFKKAYHGGYAIGAFNVNNMEIVQGITEAAQELNAPLILQVSKGARKYANHTYLMKLVEAAVIETGLPIALHLDHGDSFELCKSCIDGGFTSVMIDASSKPFEDNIALTKQVVEYAHDHGSWCGNHAGAVCLAWPDRGDLFPKGHGVLRHSFPRLSYFAARLHLNRIQRFRLRAVHGFRQWGSLRAAVDDPLVCGAYVLSFRPDDAVRRSGIVECVAGGGIDQHICDDGGTEKV